ncbi:acyltransferase family protein [Sphingomonas abietis]|uniref:Acyltransferase n=1 Tax=Sphingomonas abietis TaxID=3012344 RepID=A0ABY7NJP0_9SPHN|nr:acyltransferase [Sphingomonas abietis]WBO20848.1 acyltransferase [Sphingomonas abietis]
MRGFAALLVATFHFSRPLAESGYLAVDFFLALSGFVIAKNYSGRLRNDAALSLGRFMVLRLIRLYPLFFAGSLIGIAHEIQSTWRGAGIHLSWTALPMASLLDLLILPWPGTDMMYPINGVFWSIAGEVIVNLLFAIWLFRASSRIIAAIVAVLALCLCLFIKAPNFADSGAVWSLSYLAAARTMFSFAVGVLIARFEFFANPRSSWASLVVILGLVAILLAPIGLEWRRAFDISAILIAFPLLLIAGTKLNLPRPLVAPGLFLADISYALYAIHLPITKVVAYVLKAKNIEPLEALPLFLAGIILISFLAVHFFDKPARKYLSVKFHSRFSAKPQMV